MPDKDPMDPKEAAAKEHADKLERRIKIREALVRCAQEKIKEYTDKTGKDAWAIATDPKSGVGYSALELFFERDLKDFCEREQDAAVITALNEACEKYALEPKKVYSEVIKAAGGIEAAAELLPRIRKLIDDFNAAVRSLPAEHKNAIRHILGNAVMTMEDIHGTLETAVHFGGVGQSVN